MLKILEDNDIICSIKGLNFYNIEIKRINKQGAFLCGEKYYYH